MNILSENLKKEIDSIKLKFPDNEKRSSIIESLLIVQHHNNSFLTEELIESVADYLNVQKIDVYGDASEAMKAFVEPFNLPFVYHSAFASFSRN